MVESVDIYENNMRNILSYDNKNDVFEYRKGCADRFDSMKEILETKSLSIKKNKYLNLVSTFLNKYEQNDLELIVAELIDELAKLKKDSFSINVKTCAKVENVKDFKVYEKILEFAIQYRLEISKINYFYLDSISITNKEPYTIKLKFNTIKK